MEGRSSLSSSINRLIRAQHGTALDDVEDSDLDKRVAEILVQDAKERQKQWGTSGFTAYVDDGDPEAGPSQRPNKRFLASVIRNVDQHNQTLVQPEIEELRNRLNHVNERRTDDHRRLFGAAILATRHDVSRGRARPQELVPTVREGNERSRKSRSVSPQQQAKRDLDEERTRRSRDKHPEDGHKSSRSRARQVTSSKCRHGSSTLQQSRDEERRYERHKDRARHYARSAGLDSDAGQFQPADRRFASGDGGRSRKRQHDGTMDRDSDVSAARQKTRGQEARHQLKRPRSESDGFASDESSQHALHSHFHASIHSASASQKPTVHEGSSRKSTRADLQNLHPTELFMLTGQTSLPARFEGQALGKQKSRSRSPTIRVRVPADDEDPGLKVLPYPNLTSDRASKMDKYFQKSYDPRLDVTLDDLTDAGTGLIKEGAFDDWGTMLEMMKLKKEYKKEKEIRDAEERFQTREREAAKRAAKNRAEAGEQDRKRRRYLDPDDQYGSHSAQMTAAGTEIVGYRYVKQGMTREWDLGKEVPT